MSKPEIETPTTDSPLPLLTRPFKNSFLPGHFRIPADPLKLQENYQYRKRILDLARDSKTLQRDLIRASARDPVFFINTFGFTYDPRRRTAKELPFVLYGFQDQALVKMMRVMGIQDMIIEKSRDMGATWTFLYSMYWYWQFRSSFSFMLLSRKEDYVDMKGNPDALFWKLDFIWERLPAWIRPQIDRTDKHLANLETRSVFDGESTSGDAGRGGRRTAVGLDEFASVKEQEDVLSSTQRNTDCRIFNSTPKGQFNGFYRMSQRPDILKLRFHWSKHPIYSIGLRMNAEGKLTSPWYESEVARSGGNLKQIAQDLDIDYLNSGWNFFSAVLVNKAKAMCTPALHRGNLDAGEDGRIRFVPDRTGKFELWTNPDHRGIMLDNKKFSMGADISLGSGASNSVGSGADNETGEKVLEIRTNLLSVEDFAVEMAKAARFLNNARLAFENNGAPGASFKNEIYKQKYTNLYFHVDHKKNPPEKKNTPGWYSSQDELSILLTAYRSDLNLGLFLNRSLEAVKELEQFIMTPAGDLVHKSTVGSEDPSHSKKNHGDCVIADALCAMLVKQAGLIGKKTTEEELIEQSRGTNSSYYSRRKLWEAKQRSKALW